ncbi:MAG: hypothetical protein LBC86_08615 [Oscillospiraceae bacterium]|nr:hypothetical protein [Oscillospiraceae bacterium]
MLSKESVSLNYQREDATYVNFRSWGNSIADIDTIRIDDSEKIERLIEFLNSLELVESDVPWWNRNKDSEKVGCMIIYMGESFKYNPGDTIQFWTNYMSISYNGYDWETKSYYVRNIGYNRFTKTSIAYEFIRDLINE